MSLKRREPIHLKTIWCTECIGYCMRKYEDKMLTVVIPSLYADKSLDLTISTLAGKELVKVILVVPSVEAFAKYKHYTNISLLQETKRGIYHAFNDGLEVVDTKFVMFAGAGDMVFSNYILEQLKLNFDVDCIMGMVLSDFGIRSAPTVRTNNINLDKMISSHSVGMVFATQVHRKVGLYNPRFETCADYDLILRMLFLGFNVKTSDSMFGYWPAGGFSSNIRGIEKAKEHRAIKLVNLQTVWYINVSFAINIIDFFLIQKIKNYVKKVIKK